MKISEILIAGKAVIQNPVNWVQEAFAKDVNGRKLIDGHDPRAVCWCSVGAIEKVTGRTFETGGNTPYGYLRKALDCYSPSKFNDESTHGEVMALWDKAINKAIEEDK